MKNEICCFTGHRQIPEDERTTLIDELEHTVLALYQQGIRIYKAGGALGFDTLAAQTVIGLREDCPNMKLVLVLPCPDQARSWSEEAVTEYERIKAQADDVIYTSPQYTRGCMHKRNRALVDGSAVCVCYLTKDSGGTAYTVRYAQKRGLKIIALAHREAV